MTSASKEIASISKNDRKKPTFSRKIDYSSKSPSRQVEWSLSTLPENFRRKTKSFCSMPKSKKKTFLKENFLEMHFDFWNALLTISPKNWSVGGKLAQSPKMLKKTTFFSDKNCFSANLFYGHVECVFDNTAKMFCLKLQKKSRCTEAKRKTRFLSKQQIHSSPNCAFGHIEGRFTDHAKRTYDNMPKVFCSL